MRLQIAILSLVFLAGCSDWDKHRPYIAPEPVVQKAESIFAKLCEAYIEKYQLGSKADPTYATFYMLYNMVGDNLDCGTAVQRILAIRHLNLSGDTSTRMSLNLNLIASLEKLETLVLRGHLVESLAPLAKLPNLAVLDASETDINQDLSLLGIHKLPLERYRRLRLSIASLDAAQELIVTQLTNRFFKKSRQENKILVRALVDRGTKLEPITLGTDTTKHAATIRAWQTGAQLPSIDSSPLGSFYDPKQITEATPYITYNRGYALDFTIVDDTRDENGVRAHLLKEFAESGKGNTWSYPLNESGTGPYQIIIQPTVPTDTPTGRSGAVEVK
jgi:hypothetical protein